MLTFLQMTTAFRVPLGETKAGSDCPRPDSRKRSCRTLCPREQADSVISILYLLPLKVQSPQRCVVSPGASAHILHQQKQIKYLHKTF